jgi:hypothetical protein
VSYQGVREALKDVREVASVLLSFFSPLAWLRGQLALREINQLGPPCVYCNRGRATFKLVSDDHKALVLAQASYCQHCGYTPA